MLKNIWTPLAEEEYTFPHPNTADRQGLLSMGGNLSTERLIQAYSQGIFPWFEPGCPILWWSPNPRLILIPNELKISHSLKNSLTKSFKCSIDTAFREVITACATTSNRRNNTWITNEMIEAYVTLHQLGHAHSFEVWQEDKLVGGLYGVSLGKAFFGESMFHTVTDASKIALHHLCQTLDSWGFNFIDCQLPSAHLIGLGGKLISRNEFLYLLELALDEPNKEGFWSNELA